MKLSWTETMTDRALSPMRRSRAGVRIVVGLIALWGASASTSASASETEQPMSVTEAHAQCLKQARAGTRSHSTHARDMSAACDALAAQAGQAARAQNVPTLTSACRDEAGKGHPPGASPYKRQFREMHKMRSRSACKALAEAVLADVAAAAP